MVELAAGTATFDGAGNVTLLLYTNTNQSQGGGQTWSGTYTLPSNCVGTLNITTGNSASFTLIPYNSGRAFSLTGQDTTYSFAGNGSFPPATCLASTLSGAYTFTGNGYALASGAITGVNTISGVLQFDGAGSVAGNWSVATSGSATAASVTGHYSLVSSCIATANVTDSNGANYLLTFSVASADGANLDMLVASPAATFTATAHNTFTNPGVAIGLASGTSVSVPPGSLFTIYGFGLSAGKGTAEKFPLPPTLASAMVTVNGEIAPIYSLDNTALGKEGIINAQMPLDIPPGSVATVVVKNGNALSNAAAINIPATPEPGVFLYGNNHAAARNVDDNFSLNSSGTPAAVGSTVAVYLTGAGNVTGQNLLTTGGATPYPPLLPVASNFSATIAGIDAHVQSIDLVPFNVGGFYQANITIPKVGAGDRFMVITIGGKASNGSFISVK